MGNQVSVSNMEERSLFLFDIFYKIGISNTVRDRCKEMTDVKAAMVEFQAMLKAFEFDAYDTGSFPEGTYRSSLNSDIDTLMIYRDYPVKEKFSGNSGLLMFCEHETTPGYVKIASSWSDENATDMATFISKTPFLLDKWNGSLTNQMNKSFLVRHSFVSLTPKRHGPALKTMFTTFKEERDIVFGLPCAEWPSMASDWIQRATTNQWLSPQTIQQLIKLPCFVVPTGGKGSPSEHLEWRLSFNLQEQQLMQGLSETQYKCFMLLKYIKESSIKPVIGDGFTSYHCKIALFYTIENTDSNLWVPKRLVECFLKCINLVVLWSQQYFCPGYFIPWCNLFKGKLSKVDIDKLVNVLNDVLKRPLYFISKIKIDHIGDLFLNTMTNNERSDIEKNIQADTACVLTKRLVVTVDVIQNTIRRMIYTSYPPMPARITMTLIHEYGLYQYTIQNAINVHYLNLARIVSLTERHKQNVTKTDALFTVYSELAISLACHLVAFTLQQPTHKDWVFAASAIWFRYGMNGSVSGRLKLANIVHMMGYNKSAELILTEMKEDIEKILLASGAQNRKSVGKVFCISMETFLKYPIEKLMLAPFCGPVCFYPGEFPVTPDGLIFEMFRYIGSKQLKQEPIWLSWAVVDALTFYRFLCWQTGAIRDSLSGYISKEVKTKDNALLTHTETKHNLLAWVARDCGDIELSLILCVNSLIDFKRIQEFNRLDEIVEDTYHENNAAKIHLAVLLFDIWVKYYQ